MCKKLILWACPALLLGLSTHLALAGVDYADPDGGWAYIYTGNEAKPDVTAALDGTWDHKEGGGGSDAWDGSAPGQVGSAGTGSAPGGAGVFTDGDTTFLRIQDCGDPRDAGGGWADPSNRKLTFGHDLGLDAGVNGGNILDSGVTLSFRARIPTTPPLDAYYPDGGSAIQAWTTRGYNIHDDGYGAFGVKQGTGGNGVVSFSLCMASDEAVSAAGLVMNKRNGTSVTGNVDSYDAGGTENLLTGFDPTQWHEFWIQIVADTSGGGTHRVTIWMDNNAGAPNGTFHVTAGSKDEYDFNGYLVMSLGRTAIAGAQDVDFFAYKAGLIPPMASNPNKASAITPTPGATVALPEATPLAWKAGATAARHDVYLGTDETDVNNADITNVSGVYRGRQDLPLFTPAESLELGQTYYWRIDEVEADAATIHKGDVWSFAIIGYLLVDDFEDYNDFPPHEIWRTWIDGFGTATNGAAVGYPEPLDFAAGKHYVETTIVHGGKQAMPYFYRNSAPATYSQATRTLTSGRDWTQQGVKALSLWFRGYPPALGNFVESPAGIYTVTAEGADIEGSSDQFHFAFKQISGAGTIVAKIESVANTNPWAKAGLMIRDSLDADSAHAMVAVTPGNGIWFGRRDAAGQTTTTNSQAGIATPQWVKLERTIGGLVRAYYSADGTTWTTLGTSSTITMNAPLYIGLAVSSHNAGVACQARFSNVTTDATGQWAHQDIGLTSNQAQSMYLALSNKNRTTGTVYHEDPNAAIINTWTEWNIDLKDFRDQGVELSDVNSIAIGFGNKNNPAPGGSGKMYFDDIRLYRARYVPDKVTPLAADFNGDGTVDLADLQVMLSDWLKGDYTVQAVAPQPAVSQWTFDNNVNDSAGTNPGTLRGNPTYAAGKFGQAIRLDGDDYVDFGNPTSLDFGTGDWTVSAWIKTTMTGTGDANKGTVFAKGGDQTGGIRYTLAVGELQSGMITLTTDDDIAKIQVTGSTVVNNDTWHHVVGMRNGNELRIYVDGALNGTIALPAGYNLAGASQHNAYVGVITDNRDATLIKYYVGLIDDVRIYNYALSDNEISSVAGLSDRYVPVTSPANISDEEPVNSKRVNFRDFAILADEWLKQLVWPSW